MRPKKTKRIVKGMSTYFEKIEGIDFKDREIVFLMLNTPPFCNYKCKKCFTWASSRKIENPLTLEEVFRIIKEGKGLGARNVSILGEGEPLIYKDIKKVVQYINKMGIIPMLATNARMLTKEMADFLYKEGATVGISLDTLDSAEYNELCGGNADLNEVLKNIEYIRKLFKKDIVEKNGYKIYRLVIHMTVTPKNFKKLKQIEKFCGDDIFFDCQPLAVVGDAKKNASFFKNKMDTYENFQRFGHIQMPPMVLTKTLKNKYICCLFNYGLSIAYNGEAMFDTHSVEPMNFIGNIREYPLKNLYKKIKQLRKYFLDNYAIEGYCPIREEAPYRKFLSELDSFKFNL